MTSTMNMQQTPTAGQPTWEDERRRNRKKGALFCAGPFIGLVVILTVWSMTSYVTNLFVAADSSSRMVAAVAQDQRTRTATGGRAVTNDLGFTEIQSEIRLGETSPRATAARIINVALGFLGIICVVLLPIGFIMGIVYLSKGPSGPPQPEQPTEPPQPPTTQGPVS